MGHFEITVVTNSSDLRNYHIKKTRPAWFYCMTTEHTSCDLTHIVSMKLVGLTPVLRPLFP